MKKTLLFITTIISVLGIAGCNDDFDPNGYLEPSLSAHWLRPSETNFANYMPFAFSKIFTVESIETPWQFSDVADWITLTPSSGNASASVTLDVQENKSANTRTAIFYLQSTDPDWSYNRAISVSQATTPSLSVDTRYLSYSGSASQQKVNITANCTWTASCSDSWVSLSPDVNSGTLTISVSANPEASYRYSTVRILYGNGRYESIIITQYPATITSSAYTLEYENMASKYDVSIESEADESLSFAATSKPNWLVLSKGGTHTIELSTNEEWTAEIEHNVSWLKLSKSSGSGNAVITLTAEDNASVNTRSTAVVVNTKYSQSIRILVSQEPRHLSMSTQSILFFANGGTSETVTIDTDGTYEIKSDASWFTVNRGTGNTFTVHATKNSTNEMRRGKITISLTDLKEGSLALELTVTQAGEGGSFIINGSPKDSDRNYVSNGSLIVTVKGYTSDKGEN